MENRYYKQELCHFIGSEGQRKLQKKNVLIVGMGALGSANGEMLARAGVGTLTIVDRDYVEWSNLHRQQLYAEKDCEEMLPKVIAAKKRIEEINRNVIVRDYLIDGDPINLAPLVKEADLIIDATDNFDIRFILNDLAQKYKKSLIFGSCVGSYGMTFTIIPNVTPCLHCLLKRIPMSGATCDTNGVIAPIVQMIAAYQVTEALKLLVENQKAIRPTFLSIDLWQNHHYTFRVDKARSADCFSCGENPNYPYLQYNAQMKTTVLCGRNTVQFRPPNKQSTDFEGLEASLKKVGEVKRNPFILTFKKDDFRMVLFKDGRVFIHGTDDVNFAKKLYYQYLG